MKRLVTLLLAAGIVLGGAAMGTANAIELKAGGNWQFKFGWMDRSLEKHDGEDNFVAAQRIRPEFRFITDETLSATLQLEIGVGHWGNRAFAMGGDATNAIKFRYGYVDWVVPGLGAKVRMGQQPMGLPQYGTMALVGIDDIAGVSVNYQIVDALGLNLFWARPVNNDIDTPHDTVDLFGLVLNFKGDGFKLSPWGMIATVGEDAWLGTRNPLTGETLQGSNRGYLSYGLLPLPTIDTWQYARPDSDTVWWLGIGGELSLFDPFKIGVDFAYGRADFGSVGGVDVKRAGWMVSLLASYKLDMFTPGIAAWYGSGDDSNPNDGSERLPFIFQDVDKLANWAFDAGFYANHYSQSLSGTWGLQARIDDISFIEDLKHDLRFTWWKGTNDRDMAAYAGAIGAPGPNVDNYYLTEKDSAWMVSLDTTYKIYKNLTAQLQLAYLKTDFDSNVWGSTSHLDEHMYQAAVVMQYKF